MAVLNNTGILMGSSAVEDDAAYQIKRSLRSNRSDDPQMTRIPSKKGNKRKWTVAFWAKRCFGNTHEKIFTGYSGADACGVRILSDYVHFYHWDPDVYDFDLRTNALLRDPSAWYHIVCVYDSNNSISSDRAKIYINGKLASLQTATYPAQYHDSHFMNDANTHYLLREASNTGQDYHGYLADFQFIDGLALSPAAFGSFDSTGAWNPKAFALPAPNENTTWSSGTITNEHSTYPVSKAFDGNIGSGNDYWAPADGTASFNGFASFEPSNDIEFNQSLRIYADFDTRPGGSADDPYILVTTDTAGEQRFEGPGDNVGPEGNNMTWYTIQEGKGKLTKITSHQGALGYWCRIHGIEVDGVLLVDGKTDPATRDNPNNGTTWSDGLSGNTWNSGIYAHASAFDGGTQYGCLAAEGGTVTYSGSIGKAGDTIEIYCDYLPHANVNFTVNGTNINSQAKDQEWFTLTGITYPITAMTFNAYSNANYVILKAIRVNGHILIDSSSDNSFHLKFDEVAKDRYLGLDKLTGKLEDATGGTPLLKTTDDYGLTLGSGNATDSFSSDLKFAFAGNNVTGGSLDISGSSHSCTVTNATLVTDQSQFYGSSINFAGDAKITTPTHSDFDLGTTNWTVEFWSRPSETSSQSALVSMGDDGSGSSGILIGYASSGNLNCYGENTSPWNLFSAKSLGAERVGSWSHYAITRQGSTFRFFNNGVLTDTATHAGDVGQDVNAFTIGVGQINAVGANAYIHGNIQDFRYYNHGSDAPKYTAAFTVPKRNDWHTVTNLTPTTDVGTVYGSTMLSDGATARFYDPDSVDAYGVASRFNMFDGSLSTRCGNPDSTNVFSWDTSSYSFSGLLEVYGANTSGQTNNIFVNDVDSGVDLPGTAGWTTVGTYNSGINKVHFSANGGINLYAFRVAGTIITDTLEDSPKEYELDSLTDSPTNYGEDTGAGGEVRGNYCTINSLDHGASAAATITQGNLTINSGSSSWKCYRGTMGVSTGKWYYEVYWNGGGEGADFGIIGADKHLGLTSIEGNGGWQFAFKHRDLGAGDADVDDYFPSGPAQNKAGWWGVAIDMDAGKLWAHYQGTWGSNGGVGNPATGANAGATNLSGTVCPAWSGYYNGEASFNFGQRPWKYTCPDGFKAWCTANLPDTFSGDALNNPSKYFNAVAFNGTGNDQTIKIPSISPEFVWIKERSNAQNHQFYDVTRGTANNYKRFEMNTTAVQETKTDGVQTFNSDGFDIGGNVSLNENGETYIAWCWDAGSSAATASTEGDITPTTQWVNTEAGFSITQWTGGGGVKTIGHGLSTAPVFFMGRNLESSSATMNTFVYHHSLGATQQLFMNTTDAASGDWFNDAAPDADVWTMGDTGAGNENGGVFVGYLWREVNGFSKFGQYTGNASADGPFIYTGFQPRLVILKRDSGTGSWTVMDTTRDTYNVSDHIIDANADTAENSTHGHEIIDILSNGFKLRQASSDYRNQSGQTYVYAAWAEHPFKTARAR